jgi:hypothetical protein
MQSIVKLVAFFYINHTTCLRLQFFANSLISKQIYTKIKVILSIFLIDFPDFQRFSPGI